MNRTKLNYIVDLAFFAQFVLVGYSGLLLLIEGHDVSHFWKLIHEQLGILMLVFFIAHIALHLKWAVFTTKKFLTKQREIKTGEIIEANYITVD
ncbi:MAG TPA: DUF4405 domain-containing protein [Methanosarcina sp.]|nr:DUF4405 domain-containing protein [Methanosarcina sp.]